MTEQEKTRIFSVAGLGPGTQLNGLFEIDEKIASGGMGEVFRGHEIMSGHPIAIKVVLSELAKDETIVGLFNKEARVLRDLNHPAIVRYMAFGTDPAIGRPYLVMEFLDGPSLSERLDQGPLELAEAKNLFARLASGLDEAHQLGIIHRDISADNVILAGGTVANAKIIDFGIARTTKGKTLLEGKFAGKYNFVSPEQLGLFNGKISEATDIYSFGLLMVNTLRGTPIDMNGTQVEVIEKRRSVPDISDIDISVRPIIELMLQPDPEHRTVTMADIAEWFAPKRDRSHPPRPIPTAPPKTETPNTEAPRTELANPGPASEPATETPAGESPFLAQDKVQPTPPPEAAPQISMPPAAATQVSTPPQAATRVSTPPIARSEPPVSAPEPVEAEARTAEAAAEPPAADPFEAVMEATADIRAEAETAGGAPAATVIASGPPPAVAPIGDRGGEADILPLSQASKPAAATGAPPRAEPARRRSRGVLVAGIAVLLAGGVAAALYSGILSGETGKPDIAPPVLTPSTQPAAPATQQAGQPQGGTPAGEAVPPAPETETVLAPAPTPPVPEAAKPAEPATPPETASEQTTETQEAAGIGGTTEEEGGEGGQGDEIAAVNIPIPQPRPDPSSAVDTITSRLAWLNGYDGGNCFFVRGLASGDDHMAIEGLGTDAAPFKRIEADFKEEFGFEPNVEVRPIVERQCAVATFLSGLHRPELPHVGMRLDSDHVKSGETLQGNISGLSRPNVVLYLIDNDGFVYQIDRFLKREAEEGRFNIKLVELATRDPLPQMVLALSSDKPIRGANLENPVLAATHFPKLVEAIRDDGIEPDYAFAFFKLGGK